ncbi:uncharacterized protein LOC105689015 [Athalia rosae]|uniref:uncharacterized protein LOC105689015 n=1 Tax=Athalia rosae TaxID=37344 RepID=UPI0020333473|nr:uncharacterized protein LOC105689015 [Athalia rosae]
MRKFEFSSGLFVLLWMQTAFGPQSALGQYNDIGGGIRTSRRINETPMHKVLFTQRGYIQFLRWELPVPEIEEFTFCLWVKSTNLTYSHSILSYSKNEEERLVRSWISPFGRSVHLEIGKSEIMAHPTHLEEDRWYHICQSWENEFGRYALWIDGRKEVEGYAAQLIGHVIPSGGDIVVGQEYTDFDKGLEEGIEGAVLGFNLVLASAFHSSKGYYARGKFSPLLSYDSRIPTGPTSRLTDLGGIGVGSQPSASPYEIRRSDENYPLQSDLTRGENPIENFFPKRIVNEKQEATFDSTLNEYLGDRRIFGEDFPSRNGNGRPSIALKINHRIRRRDLWGNLSGVSLGRRMTPRVEEARQKDRDEGLGLRLIYLTYGHCEIGRGSPFIGGSQMLISWTRTPVKVFGGAILKNAKSTCGNF